MGKELKPIKQFIRGMVRMRILFFLAIVLAFSASMCAADISSLVEDLGTKRKAKDASDELAVIGKAAVPALIKALGDKDRHRGRYAARALRQMGQEAADAIPALFEALDDADADTREYSVEALGNMTEQASVVRPILARVTLDKNEDVREKAKLVLARLRVVNLSSTQVEKKIKANLNQWNENECTSVSLTPESVNRYTGYADFANGQRVFLEAVVSGGKTQYTLGGRIQVPTPGKGSVYSRVIVQGKGIVGRIKNIPPWVLVVVISVVLAISLSLYKLDQYVKAKYAYAVFDLKNIVFAEIGLSVWIVAFLFQCLTSPEKPYALPGSHYYVCCILSGLAVLYMFYHSGRLTSFRLAPIVVACQVFMSPLIALLLVVAAVVFVIALAVILFYYILIALAVCMMIGWVIEIVGNLFCRCQTRRH